MKHPKLLSIAGSDPSGGAGIQADLKTFGALDAYGMACITTLTAQNTTGVQDVHPLPAEFVERQIDSVFRDIEVDAVKIGLLGSIDICKAVTEVLQKYKPQYVVLDPVLVAQSGDNLTSDGILHSMTQDLFPIATLITPNIPEMQALTGIEPERLKNVIEDPESLRAEIENKLGQSAILLKGGHMAGEDCTDYLFDPQGFDKFTCKRIHTENTHGTGCTLSSAIAVYLAKGEGLSSACRKGKEYVSEALEASKNNKIGQGHGPLIHNWRH